MSFIAHFALNTAGHDYVVGDIHGHFSKLEKALTEIGFDSTTDRLFSVGDMVDRGPESSHALQWLRQPWFHAVRGNHEDYVCRWQTVDTDNWLSNGGSWFQALSLEEKHAMAAIFDALPLVIEVETPAGTVGITHADVPCRHWDDLAHRLGSRRGRDYCMWSRQRIQARQISPIEGVRALVVGHEPLPQPVVLGNVHHIDTRGWTADGHFTLLDLHSLAVTTPQ